MKLRRFDDLVAVFGAALLGAACASTTSPRSPSSGPGIAVGAAGEATRADRAPLPARAKPAGSRDCTGPLRFEDAWLEGYVRGAIGKADGEILPAHVQELRQLSVDASAVVTIPSHLSGGESSMVVVKGLGGIECLSRLEELRLESTQISDLEPLARLTELKQLRLDSPHVSDVTPLAGLHNLKSLNLNGTRIADLEPLAELRNLEELWLGATPVDDLTPLAGLHSLWFVFLSDTPVDDLKPLAGLRHLKRLDLDSTRASNLRPLVGLRSLTWLNLRNTAIDCVAQAEAIRVLERRHCSVESDCP